MKRNQLLRGLLLAGIALTAGCFNDSHQPTAPTVDHPQLSAAVSGGPSEVGTISLARYHVDVMAKGSFRPGAPIHLSIAAHGVLSTQDVEIRLMLPEMAAAKLSSWETVITPVDEPLPAEASWRTALSAGQVVQRHAMVSIPEPGYYRVVASILQKSDEPLVENGLPVQNVARAVLWLRIDERGGRVTAEFDPDVLPANVYKQPGPLSPLGQPPRMRSSRSGGDVSIMTIAIAIRPVYYNQDNFMYTAVPRAEIQFNRYDAYGRVVERQTKYTSWAGEMTHAWAGHGA